MPHNHFLFDLEARLDGRTTQKCFRPTLFTPNIFGRAMTAVATAEDTGFIYLG
jgi:hypothetical protein